MKKLRRGLAGSPIVTVTLVALGACSTVDTDPPPPPALEDAIHVMCQNANEGNYWSQIQSCGQGCLESVPIYGEPTICIGPTNIPGFDYIEDWNCSGTGETGGESCNDPYPNWEDKIRSICSASCKFRDKAGIYNCDDEEWTGFLPGPPLGWTPDDGLNCVSALFEETLNSEIIDDPDASEIDWNEGQGPSVLNYALGCSLVDDCGGEFDADIDQWALAFNSGGALDLISADTRMADYHSTSSTISLSIDMDSGSGTGYDDEHDLSGHAEYSATDCGDDICPFYLAAFEASNTADNWDIRLTVSGVVDEPKIVNNVHIEALQSTLAVWRPATGQVAFFADTLVLQANFEVDSTCGTCSGIGDGEWEYYPISNPDVLFGTYDETYNSLELELEFALPGGTGELSSDFAVAESPPNAVINLSSLAACNHADGYELGSGDISSTDPDNDIDGHMWLIDGVPSPTGSVVGVGTHTIDLLAVDDRGAHDYAGSQSFEVTRAAACL